MSDKGLAAASKKLNQPLAFKNEQEVELGRFCQEIMTVINNSEKIYRYSDTDVGKTGALDLFMLDVSPFISFAKYKITSKKDIYEKVIAAEITVHQQRWTDYIQYIA